MARPTQPRRPTAAQPVTPPEPKVAGTPQRRRAVRAAGQTTPPRPASARPGAGAPAPRRSPSRPTDRPAERAPQRSGDRPSRVADLAGARRARRWRPGRRTLTAAAIALVVLVAGGWVLLASPWLRVSEITVTGTERTDVTLVDAIVEPAQGVPLARVDTRAIRSAIDDLPLVESVDVTRSWPATLVVTVHERQAVAAVGSTSGGVDLVDGEGNVLAHEDTAPQGVPTLDVNVAAAGNEALQAAIAVNATLSTDVRSRVASIAATTPDAVTLQIIDGPEVVWGDESRPERKAEVLLRLLADPEVAGSSVVNVSAPDSPAVTP